MNTCLIPVYIYPQQDVTQGQFLNCVNWFEFRATLHPVILAKAKEQNPSYYFPLVMRTYALLFYFS